MWDYVDAGVAYVFGLNESKYQWAIDRHNQQLAQVSQQYTDDAADGACKAMHDKHTSSTLTNQPPAAGCNTTSPAAAVP